MEALVSFAEASRDLHSCISVPFAPSDAILLGTFLHPRFGGRKRAFANMGSLPAAPQKERNLTMIPIFATAVVPLYNSQDIPIEVRRLDYGPILGFRV